MPGYVPKKAPKKEPTAVQSAINNSDADYHCGQIDGVNMEATRIKEALDKRYKELVELFNKEINIGTRYELKLRIETIQDMYTLLFKGGK